MITINLLFARMLCSWFKPRQQLQAEILVLRHQLNVLRQRAPRRPHLRWADRALLIWLYRRCPGILSAITIRSDEHTSELQSRSDLVCRLLLEKKKTHN